MEAQKIQLKHPQGKKAVSISKDKYDLLSAEIVQCLTTIKEATFTEISLAVAKSLKNKKIVFDGSLNWYLEWVKLDLEANQRITKVIKSSPQKYTICAE